MDKEKYETILDYGSSKIRAGVIDIDNPQTKFFIDENCKNEKMDQLCIFVYAFIFKLHHC